MSSQTLIVCPHKFCATTTRVWTANPRFYGSVDAYDSFLVACRVPHLLSSSKHPYHLGTKYPNLWAWGNHSHSNLHRPFHCLVWQREMHLFCRAEPFNGIPGISSCFLSFGSLILCQYHEMSIWLQHYDSSTVLLRFPCDLTWILGYFLQLCRAIPAIKSHPLLYWSLNFLFMLSGVLFL